MKTSEDEKLFRKLTEKRPAPGTSGGSIKIDIANSPITTEGVMPGKSQFYKSITQERMIDMLKADLGYLWQALSDKDVTEISVNSNGVAWQDRIGAGREQIDIKNMPPDKIMSILLTVASAKGEEIGERNPSFDALIPGYGYRFVGTLPPLTAGPAFTIRKKPESVFSLAEYVEKGIMTGPQLSAISEACYQRDNIIVAGGTGSGKTTLANSILQEMANTGHRIITIEDTPELRNSAADSEALYTVPGVRTAQDCLRVALRMHPDRIVFGECRGAEVRDMLMAWNTGHRGGLCTIHADSPLDTLYRIEEMLETIPNYQPRPRQIARAVNVIVFIEATKDGRKVREICRVDGWECNPDAGYALTTIGV